jgi:uncharacterized protein (TIGR03663 family)
LEKQVPTASTKRRNRKPGGDWGAVRSGGEAAGPAPEPPPPSAADLPERAWLVASLIVLAVAALLRLYALELKPMHHDEGVNGFFLTDLVRQGNYKYNPENYHGPTLYYLSLPFVYVWGFFSALLNGRFGMAAIREAGLDTTAVRLLTAVCGVATVWLVLALRRHVGALAALAGAALLAVSPGAVYYSRYFIHETLFVLFTLGIVVAALRLYEIGSYWRLSLLAASAALLFATKETAFISVGVLGLAVLFVWFWEWTADRPEPPAANARGRKQQRQARGGQTWTGALVERLGGRERAATMAIVALTLFLFINLLFYSSFFTYWQGVGGAVESLKVWTKTGTSEFHKKSVHTYVGWLWQEEAPILILAAVGAAVALYERRRNRFAIFAGAWAFGVLAAYSLIPYKTPWLALSFVVPMCVVAGYAVQSLARLSATNLLMFLAACVAGGVGVLLLGGETAQAALSKASGVGPATLQAALVFVLVGLLAALGLYLFRADEGREGGGGSRAASFAAVVAGLACAVCAYQAWVLNFREYDNDRYPYVYSHSQRGMLDMVGEVERLAVRAGRGKETGITVASPEYWPLPWYFRDYKGVGYVGSVAARYDAQSTPVVIGRESTNPAENQTDKLRAALGPDYQQVGIYDLRPGVRLIVFARRDLVENSRR